MTQAVEAALADLAHHIDWPPEIDVAIAPRRAPSLRLVWAVALATVLVAVTVIPAGREAVAGLARVVGIRIEFRETTLDIAPGLDLGAVVEREKAVEAVEFELTTPTALDLPDAFYLREVGGVTQVWSVWKESDDLSAIEGTTVGLILTQFEANPEEESIIKLVSAGIQVITVDVNGAQGYWLAGGPHFVVFNEGDFAEASRSNGAVLIWANEGITYRMETSLALPAALELARDLEPLG